MITTYRSSHSIQSIMNDETLCDDLTTLNQNSSSSILYRTLNIHYISQEYVFRKENSSQSIKENKPEISRNISIIELITSEQRFVNDLNNILKTYITPMLEGNILTSSHIDALFLNWPSLTRTHEKLANTLITALKTDGEQIPIGKILCEFLPKLIPEYEMYFRFHPTAMKCFREQLHHSSKFRLFMQVTKEQSSGIGTLGDANILTLPLQRIAKYPYMIDQIIKNTSKNNSDLHQLHNSLKKANELRETINNAIDEEINRVKFEWLQTHVDCSKINEAIIFNSLTHFGEQRKLVHYNRLKLKADHLYAMLFNDFLLLTRIKRPFITKFLQIMNQKIFNNRREESNIDWFDSFHGNLVVYKQPIMLHEIRHVKITENNSKSFQFDYRGRQMIFLTNNSNERLLWVKNLTDQIHHCRKQCLLTSIFRAPELSQDINCQSIGKVFIREINVINLPFISQSKNGNNPYCIIEMNHSQRQTTAVLCDTLKIQWNIFFRFFIYDIKQDFIKCFVYNRSKYTTDRLLGSVEIPLTLLIERGMMSEDLSSVYSLGTNHLSEISVLNWKIRRFYLQNSSTNCQISIKYHVQLNE